MKIDFEVVHPDEGSSFRLLHTKTRAEDYGWEYHYHPEYEIVCVLDGNGTRHVGNHFSSYKNGDLVFIGPNLPHSGFGLNSSGFHEEIVVQVKDEVITPFIAQRPEMSAIQSLLDRAGHGVHFMGEVKERITKRLTRLLKLPTFERFVELFFILQIMATSDEYELLNPTTDISSQVQKNNSRLQNIFTYVEEHYNEEIDIKKVAAIANLSVPAFCNYFKKVMHSTFTDFINQYRIQKACTQLHQEKTIAEICFDCGFNNVAYFNKVFKNITNKTPTEYKKERLRV